MTRFPTLTAAALLLAAPALAQSLDMADVPQAARDAANAEAEKFGISGFESVALDEDDGSQTYEFAGMNDKGMAFEVDVLADGTVEEIEEEVAMADLPAAVTDTLAAELEGFEPTFIERSTRPDGSIVFEFEGMHDGTEIDAEIAEDGTGFTMNEDTAA